MNPIFALLNGMEVVAILAVILVLFGAKKLPELARGLGQGIREFKKSSREITDEIQSAVDVDAPPPPPRRIDQTTVSRTDVDVTPAAPANAATPAHTVAPEQHK